MVVTPTLLALFTLALLMLGSSLARASHQMRVDDPLLGRSLFRFYPLEVSETGIYRWSRPEATLFLYGYDGRAVVTSLRLAAFRPADQPVALVHLRSDTLDQGSFPVDSVWRTYHLLMPMRPTGETPLYFTTAAYQSPADPRELGVALSDVTIAATPGLMLHPVRLVYLLGWPLLGWLALVRLRASPRLAVGGGLVMALGAGWAAAFPVEAGYWWPTLGWPWWPLLPFALLMGARQLGLLLARVRSYLISHSTLSLAGIGLALGALLALRLGFAVAPGMLLLVVGTWLGQVWLKRAALRQGLLSTRKVAIMLALLGLLALGTRLVNLDTQPAGLWRDESRHGLQALRIWEDPAYRPVYVVEGADLPALLFYLMAPVIGSFGPHPWSVRLVSALAGALTPLALYWASVPLIGRRAALVAAGLLASASWALSMSRWAFPATLDHLLVLTALGLVWRTLPVDASQLSLFDAPRTKPEVNQQRRSIVPSMIGMAVAGLLGGLAMYTYHTGRLAPVALGAAVVIRLGLNPYLWRKAAPGLAIALVVGALMITPLGLAILGDLEGYNRRVGTVSWLDANNPVSRTPLALALDNLQRYALAYHAIGERNGRHHLPDVPLLDPVTGLLLALGLGAALPRLRQQPGLLVVVTLGVIYLVPAVLSNDAPHAMRALGTLAPACMLAGIGFVGLRYGLGGSPDQIDEPAPSAFASTISRVYPKEKPVPPLIRAAPLMLLGASLLFNLWLYFGVMRLDPRVYGEFDLVETAVGRLIQQDHEQNNLVSEDLTIYLPEALRTADTVRFMTWGIELGRYDGRPLEAEGAAVILLPASADDTEQAAALAALGAEGRALGVVATKPHGTPLVLAFGRGQAADRMLR
ncbi:glycosyltransferase family 39 protein [Candidatus Chloroploca sp. Khr17]|uniref:ArnT family glycosyltransferase n=1 Tax=Candidatus Chloroploca sp. Khr17 TaxID=2496869 RepID=UPI00101D6DAB|nr:glycosyltransferase family 39 protein [Candidatus Chloroploca sp. Khr17]